jgi:hypothetical protein
MIVINLLSLLSFSASKEASSDQSYHLHSLINSTEANSLVESINIFKNTQEKQNDLEFLRFENGFGDNYRGFQTEDMLE